jgi:hypothetical protein
MNGTSTSKNMPWWKVLPAQILVIINLNGLVKENQRFSPVKISSCPADYPVFDGLVVEPPRPYGPLSYRMASSYPV